MKVARRSGDAPVNQDDIMKIVVLFNSQWAIPAISELIDTHQLVGIGIPQKTKTACQQLLAMVPGAESLLFHLRKEDWVSALSDRLSTLKPDVVVVITFPWRIPGELLVKPPFGFINVHFGSLPKYAGNQPVFRQVRNREPLATVTIHRMDDTIDTGPIVLEKSVPLSPQDTFDLANIRMSYLAVEAVKELVDRLSREKENLKTVPQAKGERPYLEDAGKDDVTIDWDRMTAEEIMALTNAANSWNLGAFAYIRGLPMRILEVTILPAPPPGASPGQTPGTIIALDDREGLLVACRDNKILRIEIVYMDIGFITGKRLSSLGISSGEKFSKG